MEKKCIKCSIIKSELDFYERKDRPGKFRSICKDCTKAQSRDRKDYHAAHYKENRDTKIKQVQDYYEKNKDIRKEYYKKRLPVINEARRERYKTDINYKLACNLRSRLHVALKRNKKADSSMNLLGCTLDDLKNHIESKFTDGMSWELVMSAYIHIDHIKPVSSFDLTDPLQQKECFHYTNLQPLWAADNRKKYNK